MVARFAELTKAEIMALLEKATPEITKEQLNNELRFLMVSLRNEEIFQVLNYKFKTNIETFVQNIGVCFTN